MDVELNEIARPNVTE